jgi:RNA polymerase sigma factor (sigma-70 family)
LTVTDQITRLMDAERVAELRRAGALASARPTRSTSAKRRVHRARGREMRPAGAPRADAAQSTTEANTADLPTRTRLSRVPSGSAPRGLNWAAERRPPAGRLSDEDLVRLVRSAAAGEEAAWDALVQAFDRMLRGIAHGHRLRDADVADVVQTTWLKLCEHVADLKDPARLGGWLATTAHRECLGLARASERQATLSDDVAVDCESSDTSPADMLLTRERNEALWHGFSRLPVRDQALLRLLAVDPPHAYRHISATLDMARGSIGPTRARALQRLREELSNDGTLALLARPDHEDCVLRHTRAR